MTHEASEGFTRIDIEKYADSETLAKIKAEAKARKEGKTSEEKTDVDIEKQSKNFALLFFIKNSFKYSPIY